MYICKKILLFIFMFCHLIVESDVLYNNYIADFIIINIQKLVT